jgi:hypothetical protein
LQLWYFSSLKAFPCAFFLLCSMWGRTAYG